MPQTLTEEWQKELGTTADEDREQLLHTLGNLSAAAFHRFCVQATQLAGLGSDEWRVRYAPRTAADGGTPG